MKGHVEIIKEKLPIEQVIGSYIRLEPNGANFKARCPFHMEKTPSFSITPEKGMFYCYGCQKGGDIFSFIQEIEKITFREALEKLAKDAGVDISSNTSDRASNTKKLFDICSTASRFYHTCLRQTPRIIEYLESRGLQRETMKNFAIGYSPGFGEVITVLQKKFSNNDIVDSGIGILGNRGLFDRFARRIVFPILDHQGRVVGFTARIVPGDPKEGSVGKYINSPETGIYHKSKVLFGYYQAKKSILEKKYAVLVEGNMDVIMLHQSGFTESVGVSGTACTQEHITLLHRITDHIVLAFDQDSAGISALHKTALLAIEKGLQVSVVQYAEKDPAEVLEKSPDQWKAYLDNRQDYFQYLLHQAQNIFDAHKKNTFIKNSVFPVIRVITQKTLQHEMLEFFARGLSWSVDALQSDFIAFEKTLSPYTENNSLSRDDDSLTSVSRSSHAPLDKIYKEIKLFQEFYPNDVPSNLEGSDIDMVLPLDSIQVSESEKAAFITQVRHLDNKHKHEYVLRLYNNAQILILEQQYQKTMEHVRELEFSPKQSSIYQEKLLLSQDLLVRIHTLRSRVHQS